MIFFERVLCLFLCFGGEEKGILRLISYSMQLSRISSRGRGPPPCHPLTNYPTSRPLAPPRSSRAPRTTAAAAPQEPKDSVERVAKLGKAAMDDPEGKIVGVAALMAGATVVKGVTTLAKVGGGAR